MNERRLRQDRVSLFQSYADYTSLIGSNFDQYLLTNGDERAFPLNKEEAEVFLLMEEISDKLGELYTQVANLLHNEVDELDEYEKAKPD